MKEPLLETNIPVLRPPYRGKVRDVYEIGSDKLLIVTTDRYSAFDVVLGSGIPGRGIILNQMSLFWYKLMKDIVPSHLITATISKYPRSLQVYKDQLAGRSMIVHKAEMFPVECVVRGYLSGSGWKDYQETGAVCGNIPPPGLVESSKLSTPIFTPATKAEHGKHDENINLETAGAILGQHLANNLRKLSLQIYKLASDHALQRGIILADTKFEFGWANGSLVIADEVLTPDSSRFWPADQYQPGTTPPSLDKQPVRDYLAKSGWNKKPPGPELPPNIIQETLDRYLLAYFRLTEKHLSV